MCSYVYIAIKQIWIEAQIICFCDELDEFHLILLLSYGQDIEMKWVRYKIDIFRLIYYFMIAL